MRKSKGFTIVEVLIVIVVIGILAAIVITTIGGIKSGGTRYRIDTADGSYYWTDQYEEKDGCVTFNYWNGQKKACGSYTIGQY